MSQMTGQTSYRTRIRQLANLAGFIVGVLADLPEEKIRYWLGEKTYLKHKLQEVFQIPASLFVEVRTEWEEFYKDYFGLAVDFSTVSIPAKPVLGSWRLIFVPQGLTLNATIAAMRKHFKVWVYTEDLDDDIPTNTRTSATAYAVWVQVSDEPDAEFLGKSTRTADMEGKIGVTLLERLLLGFKHFTETGKHLDIKGVTFCTGSRSTDGGVPGVCWRAGGREVSVCWYRVDGSSGPCGLRQAVS